MFKRVTVAVILTACALPVPAPAAEAPIFAPCTQLIVQLTQSVGSSTAHPGNFVGIKSVGALALGGRVLVPAGTPGYAIVTAASPAGRGKGGVIGMEPLYLSLGNGAKLQIVRDRRANALSGQGSNGNLPGIAGAVPIPGAGLIVGAVDAFKKGKDVTIPAGTIASTWASDSPATSKCNVQ